MCSPSGCEAKFEDRTLATHKCSRVLGACVVALEYLGLAILQVEFSFQAKCSAKSAAKG